MGCFNSTGFISRLPIVHGDRVVCFIGILKNESARELYYPDALVSPYFLPIRGYYDDYGSVKNVDRTTIVEMIERCAGQPIEELCRGIERCLYGQTINDNIKYWSISRSGEQEKYVKLVSFFKGRFYHEDGGDVSPVLLFEHEEIYDNLFSSDDSEECLKVNRIQAYVGEIEKFYKVNKRTIDKDPELLTIITNRLPSGQNTRHSLFGRDSLRKTIRKIDEKYSFPMSYPFLMVGANSDTFSMFNKLTLQEKFAVYRECIDEVRRMVTMWHFFREAPMYISFSKTGDQCFNFKNFEVLNKIVSNKIKEMQDSENE